MFLNVARLSNSMIKPSLILKIYFKRNQKLDIVIEFRFASRCKPTWNHASFEKLKIVNCNIKLG